MKELIRCAFVGAYICALSSLGVLSWTSVVMVLSLSISTNYIIDVLAAPFGGIPSRTKFTHSVFTTPVWVLSCRLSRSGS